jgi:hypothetical protein
MVEWAARKSKVVQKKKILGIGNTLFVPLKLKGLDE